VKKVIGGCIDFLALAKPAPTKLKVMDVSLLKITCMCKQVV